MTKNRPTVALLLLLTVVALAASLSACGGGGSSPAPGNTPEAVSAPMPTSLEDALRLMAEEHASALATGGVKGASVVPETLNGDDEWQSGPLGSTGISEDTINHTLTLTASSTDVADTSDFYTFAIYRFENHAADTVNRVELNANATSGDYYVYVGNYDGPSPKWAAYGPYTGAAQQTLDLAFDAVSAAGTAYVATVVFYTSSVTVGNLTVKDSTFVPPSYYETENNEVTGDNNDRSAANPLPAFPFDGDTVTASLGGIDQPAYDGYDEDGVDWFSFEVTEPGLVSITMLFEVNGGSGVGDLELELWDEAGASALESSAGVEVAERIDYQITAPGTYYIKCRNRDINPDSYGDYRLWGRFHPDSEGATYYYETEGNDTFGVADTLPALPFGDNIVTGSIGATGQYDGSQEDWYSFTLANQRIVTVNLYSDSGDTSPELALIDSDGATVITEETGDGDWTGVTAVLDADTYFVRVRETGAAAGGDYELTSQLQTIDPGAYFETEDNDASGQADALPAFPFSGPSTNGSLGQGGGFIDGDDEDWFSFTIPTDKIVTLSLTRATSGGTPKISLIDTDGSTEIAADTSSPYQITRMLTAGTYFLLCEDTSLTGGFDYYLEGTVMDFDPGNYDEVEDNDTSTEANTLPAFPFDYSDFLGSLGDGGGFYDGDSEDWFKFTVTQPGTLKIRLQITTVSENLDLNLYDTDGTTLLADSVSSEQFEGINYHFTVNGTYYVQAEVSSGASDYSLKGEFITGSQSFDESEDNDTFGTGDTLTLPATDFTGNSGQEGVNDGDPEDWYVITLGADGAITVHMDLDTVGGDIDVALYESDGTTEIDSSVGTDSTEDFTTDVLTAGTYYLLVYEYDGDEDTSDYSLDVSSS